MIREETTEKITETYLSSIRSLIAQLPAEIAAAEEIEIQATLRERNAEALVHGATDHQLSIIETRLQKRVIEYRSSGN